MVLSSLSTPDSLPSIPDNSTPQQRIAIWVDVCNACEQFLLAGLRREIGPEGDLKEAYRAWYREHMEEHDRTVHHMMEEFERRSVKHGG